MTVVWIALAVAAASALICWAVSMSMASARRVGEQETAWRFEESRTGVCAVCGGVGTRLEMRAGRHAVERIVSASAVEEADSRHCDDLDVPRQVSTPRRHGASIRSCGSASGDAANDAKPLEWHAVVAAIMLCVFGPFVLGEHQGLKMFGLSLATAVLIDATVVRLCSYQ